LRDPDPARFAAMDVYDGRTGEHTRENDLEIIVLKGKQLTNGARSAPRKAGE
jgi:predicted membrane GTPase involved in stress response